MSDAPEFYARNRAAWRQWLQKNHAKEQAVWLVFDKGPNRTLRWEEIVQEELCFGWIDGQAQTVSDTQSKIRITRRKAKGTWSKINKAHIEKLIAEGRMMPAGLAAIEEAKRNGSWDALNRSDALEAPPEFDQALEANAVAREHWEAWSPSRRRLQLQRLWDAKRPETLAKRVAEVIKMAELNLKP